MLDNQSGETVLSGLFALVRSNFFCTKATHIQRRNTEMRL